MPFREATVLVTVEREGVLWQKVVSLDGKSPVIEVPMLGTLRAERVRLRAALRGRVDPEVPGPYRVAQALVLQHRILAAVWSTKFR